MHARLDGGNQQFWDGLEADWRRKQKPDFEPVRSDDSWPADVRTWLETERREGRIYKNRDEAASVYVSKNEPNQSAQTEPDPDKRIRRIPFANPSEEWLREDRINRAIQSGGRPDPKDLADRAAEQVRYQREVAEAFERKRKELESEAASQSKETLSTLGVREYPQGTVANSATPVAEDTRSIVKPPRHIPIPEIPPDTSPPLPPRKTETVMVPVSEGSNAHRLQSVPIDEPVVPAPDTAPSSWSIWIQRGALTVAGGLAWWLFEKFDAPVLLVVATLIVCLVSLVAVRWLEKTTRRRNIFIIFLLMYAVSAGVLTVVFRKPPGTPQRTESRDVGALPTLGIIRAWGADPREGCSSSVAGQLLEEYADQYDVIIACGIESASIDQFADTAITVSSKYTIRPSDIPIETPVSDSMKKAVLAKIGQIPRVSNTNVNVQIRVWYQVAVIPKNLDLTRVQRLSDVSAQGGRVLVKEGRAVIVNIPLR
jgi:hypothetical protein